MCPPSQECPSCHLSLPFSFPPRPCSARYGRTGLLRAVVCCVRWFAVTQGMSLPRAGRNAGAAALVTSRGFPLPPHSAPALAQQLCKELWLCRRLCLCVAFVITNGPSMRFPYTLSLRTAAPAKAGAAHTETRRAARAQGSCQTQLCQTKAGGAPTPAAVAHLPGEHASGADGSQSAGAAHGRSPSTGRREPAALSW